MKNNLKPNLEIKSIGFALSPDNIPAFLLDWELTKRCNLDCSYCGVGIEYGGHENSTQHPPLDECLKSIDFMYEYVDLYMQHKKPTQRKVILNVYGGESLFHPDIIEILEACHKRYKPYADRWELTITTTTNAIINKSIWNKIIPLIDEFTVSYHAENLPKQEKLFFNNLKKLQEQNKRVRCIVMMHPDPTFWNRSVNAVNFCRQYNFKYVAKVLDDQDQLQHSYTNEQFNYLRSEWGLTKTEKKEVYSLCEGRACCGGRKMSVNNDLKSSVIFVEKQGFKGWYCSVNWFFLFVQQLTGNIYVNKDCRMTFDGKVAPIGNIRNYDLLLNELTMQLTNKSMPIIKCAKSICACGYCAPKAEHIEDFKDLITRNVITDVIKYE